MKKMKHGTDLQIDIHALCWRISYFKRCCLKRRLSRPPPMKDVLLILLQEPVKYKPT